MDTTLACTKNNIAKSSLSATAADIKTIGTNNGIVNNEDDDDNVGDQNMNPMDTEKEGKSTNKDEEQVNNVDKKSTITVVSASNMDDTNGTIVELVSLPCLRTAFALYDIIQKNICHILFTYL